MDIRFNSDEQWFVSPLINLQKFKEEAVAKRRELRDIMKNPSTSTFDGLEDILCQRTGCSKEEAAEVYADGLLIDNFHNEVTDISHRTLDYMRSDNDEIESSTLETMKGVKNRNSYSETSRQRKSTYITSLKYDKYQMQANETSRLFRPQTQFDQACEDDFVITVDVLVPYNRILTSAELRSSRLLRPQFKFLLRGATLLYDLRQRLICPCDLVFPLKDGKELEKPDFESGQSTMDLFPSNFMFIHDTFYVDLTDPNSKDISLPIREFMGERKIFEPVDAKEMKDVRICDLNLRLGQPYLFQHSGVCEHLMIFHDLRLMHPTDLQSIEDYPLKLFEKASEKKCDTCHKTSAAYVTEMSDLVPTTFTYFCADCFEEFNFTNGIKNHAFRAWPIYDWRPVK